MMEIRWRRQWGGADKIVWVIVRKVDAAWRHDALYLDGPAYSFKYDRFEAWLLANHETRKVNMPHLGVYKGIVSFADGRHRFAWCRDHEVRAMPVTVSGGREIREVGQQFGSGSRRCIVPGLAATKESPL